MSVRKFLKKLLTPTKSGKRSSFGFSSSSRDRELQEEEVELDPNPYNMFLLCPRHATTRFVSEIYQDEVQFLRYLLEERPHPSLSPGTARKELVRRELLSKDKKEKIRERIQHLDVARNALVDPEQRAIVDAIYGGRTNCYVCTSPIAPYDESGSALMSSPRPYTEEWRKSTGNRLERNDS
ncbi:hypothetical protein TWF730_005601 [Orbilia blumenaviensis]|uniref:Uncharacterized protein n=1 Tax=Orbilia blumenaviensis TaxID=1796055 RepID=A0AAV9VIV2_9PEZI